MAQFNRPGTLTRIGGPSGPLIPNPSPIISRDAYSTAVFADGPVAYWRLGEATGTVAYDIAGQNPGAYTGGVTLGATSAFPADTAATFSAASTQRVIIPDANALDFGDGPFTIELWFKRTGAYGGAQSYLISKTNQYGLFFDATDHIGIDNDSSNWVSSTTTYGASDTGWHYLGVTKNLGGSGSIYVDGVDVSTSQVTKVTASNAAAIWLGGYSGGGSYFTGSMDEVALYRTALTPTQIAAHYAAAAITASTTVQPPVAPLVVTGLTPTTALGVPPAVSALVVTGFAPAVVVATVIQPAVAAIVVTGLAPTTALSVPPAVAALTAAGQAVTLASAIQPAVSPLVVTGFAPSISNVQFVTPAVCPVVVTGFAPSLSAAVVPAVSAIVVTGQAVALATTFPIPVAAVVVNALSPTVALGVKPAVAPLVVTGLTGSLSLSVKPANSALVVTGFAPSIPAGTTIQPPVAALTVTGYAPSIFNAQGMPYRTDKYGIPFSMDSKTNLDVGGAANQKVAMRFKAGYSGAVSTLAFNQRGGPGYSLGTGGSMRVSIQGDSSNLPDGVDIGYFDLTPGNPGGGWEVHDANAFTVVPTLVAGTWYHIVWTNTDASPAANYIGVNMVWNNDPDSPRQPGWDDGFQVEYYRSGAWKQPSNTAELTQHTGLFDLKYASGFHDGHGYLAIIDGYQQDINGTTKMVRQSFTPTTTVVVKSVSFRLKRTSGTGPISVRLESSGGTNIETVVSPNADSIVLSPHSPTALYLWGGRWATATFSTPQTLTAGTTYRVRLSTDSSTTYVASSVRPEDTGTPIWSSWTYRDGVAEVTTDGTTWGGMYPFADSMLQMFFDTLDLLLPPANAAIVVSGPAPSISNVGGTVIQPGVRAIVLTGPAPALSVGIKPAVGALVVAGPAPGLNAGVKPANAPVVVTGFAPSLNGNTAIQPAVAALVVSGPVPGLAVAIPPARAQVVVTGFGPSLATSTGAQSIQPAVASLVVTGYAPYVFPSPRHHGHVFDSDARPRLPQRRNGLAPRW